jgi:hypothetical protein
MAEKKAQTTVSPEDFEALKQLVQEQAAKIEELEQAAPKKPKPEVKLETPKETFTVDDVKYKFTVPQCILPGRGTVATKDLLKEPAVLEELVLKKSGIIKKV